MYKVIKACADKLDTGAKGFFYLVDHIGMSLRCGKHDKTWLSIGAEKRDVLTLTHGFSGLVVECPDRKAALTFVNMARIELGLQKEARVCEAVCRGELHDL